MYSYVKENGGKIREIIFFQNEENPFVLPSFTYFFLLIPV